MVALQIALKFQDLQVPSKYNESFSVVLVVNLFILLSITRKFLIEKHIQICTIFEFF